MPLPVRFFVFEVLARIVRFKTSSKTSTGKGNFNIPHSTSTCTYMQRKIPTNGGLLKPSTSLSNRAREDDVIVHKLSSIADILEDKIKSEKKSEEWQEAAIIIDKFFLWLFIVVTAAGTTAVIFQAPSMQY